MKQNRTKTPPPGDPAPANPQHLIGYARVSMSDQDNRRQIDALVKFGVDERDIYEDHASGRTMNRKGWIACWKDLREGDLLVVQAIDRLGRNVSELFRTLHSLHAKGADLKVLNMDLDTRTAAGRLIFGMLALVAQWEREMIVERTRHGLAVARAMGKIGGAEKRISDKDVKDALRRIAKGEKGTEVAREYGVRRQTLYKRMKQMQEKAK